MCPAGCIVFFLFNADIADSKMIFWYCGREKIQIINRLKKSMRVTCLNYDRNVLAAIFALFSMLFHSAFSTSLIFGIKQRKTDQLTHTIVLVNRGTGNGAEV
jgi:hypothetical protein